MSALALVPATDLDVLGPLVKSANAYAAESKSSGTRRVYGSHWRAFEAWCSSCSLTPLPASPSLVATYLAALADQGKRPSTIGLALAAIAFHHQQAGHTWTPGKVVSDVMSGIRRTLGVRPVQKAPVLDTDLAVMCRKLGSDLGALRDRALLTLGFLGAFRRAELVALDVADLEATREGYIVHVRRSKTDQEGAGMVKAIPYASDANVCPVRALQAWLSAASISEGPVFRAVMKGGKLGAVRLQGRAVARVVKLAAADVGLDAKRFAGHSLRAGFVTAAAKRGKTIDAIMRQTGHRNPATVTAYVRLANAFDQSAAVGLV
jgi:integrase